VPWPERFGKLKDTGKTGPEIGKKEEDSPSFRGIPMVCLLCSFVSIITFLFWDGVNGAFENSASTIVGN